MTQETSAAQEPRPPARARAIRVVLAGGGTAGHIEPALALADALRRRDPRTGITALGTAKGPETTLVPERGYDLDADHPADLDLLAGAVHHPETDQAGRR